MQTKILILITVLVINTSVSLSQSWFDENVPVLEFTQEEKDSLLNNKDLKIIVKARYGVVITLIPITVMQNTELFNREIIDKPRFGFGVGLQESKYLKYKSTEQKIKTLSGYGVSIDLLFFDKIRNSDFNLVETETVESLIIGFYYQYSHFFIKAGYGTENVGLNFGIGVAFNLD